MNKRTRKEIDILLDRISDLKNKLITETNTSVKEFEDILVTYSEEIENIKSEVNTLYEDEREKADNMYDKWYGTSIYDAIDEAASNLEYAVDYLDCVTDEVDLDSALTTLDDTIDALTNAKCS